MARPVQHATAAKRSLWLAAGGVAAFALGFAVANRFQLTHGVLYRLAANDYANAAATFLSLAVQAAALLVAIVLLTRRLFVAAMVLGFVSIAVNLGYGQTVRDVIDAGKLAWMAGEARQAGNAAGEFALPLVGAGLQTAGAIALFVAARAALRWSDRSWSHRAAPFIGAACLLVPSVLAPLGPVALSAERNIYSLAIEVASAKPPPARAEVELRPDTAGSPRHIVWLVDESVAYRQFQELLAPRLAAHDPVDFGMAASLSHCSAPSNLALRSGVEVRKAGPHMDLRTTPSIWAYARKAGYRTVLVDGQTRGAPQNLLLAPELALIDDVRAAAGSYETDLAIAGMLNRQLRGGARTFTYVVLRGVHFQYRDHYPPGTVPAGSSVLRQYQAALAYSKTRFFDRLLAGVDRDEVAIVYTSDHGQHIAEGVLPHCSRTPAPEEFHVPLLAFLPQQLARRYPAAGATRHAASQIFPATLIWMGYDAQAVQGRYDHDLSRPPVRYVWFDRNVVPLGSGDPIGVTLASSFPGAGE